MCENVFETDGKVIDMKMSKIITMFVSLCHLIPNKTVVNK